MLDSIDSPSLPGEELGQRREAPPATSPARPGRGGLGAAGRTSERGAGRTHFQLKPTSLPTFSTSADSCFTSAHTAAPRSAQTCLSTCANAPHRATRCR